MSLLHLNLICAWRQVFDLWDFLTLKKNTPKNSAQKKLGNFKGVKCSELNAGEPELQNQHLCSITHNAAYLPVYILNSNLYNADSE